MTFDPTHLLWRRQQWAEVQHARLAAAETCSCDQSCPAVRHEPQSQGSPGNAQSEHQSWSGCFNVDVDSGLNSSQLANKQPSLLLSRARRRQRGSGPQERESYQCQFHTQGMHQPIRWQFDLFHPILAWLWSGHAWDWEIQKEIQLGDSLCGAVGSQLADWNREWIHAAGQVSLSESNIAQVIINYWPICCSTDQGKVYQLISRRRFHHLEVLEGQNIFILLANIECWCKT